jgi:hypothetical protein
VITVEFAAGFFLVSCFTVITFSLFGDAEYVLSFEKTILSILLSAVVSATLWIMAGNYDRAKYIVVKITIFLSKWIPVLALLLLSLSLYFEYSYKRDIERAKRICADRYDEYMNKESHLNNFLYGCYIINMNKSSVDKKKEAIDIVISEDELLRSR